VADRRIPDDASPDRAAVAFARVLRGSGLDVPLVAVTNFAEALALLGVARGDAVYWAGRATLVRRPEDFAAYDRAFAAFWSDSVLPAQLVAEADDIMLGVDTDLGTHDDAPEQDEPELEPAISVRFSRNETLRDKDFALYSHAEHAEARRLMADLRFAGSPRQSRRLRATVRSATRHPDLRRTLRRALRTGGVPISRAWMQRDVKPRRVVFLCDISASMDAYSRSLLRFVQAAAAARSRVEVFALGTRLTRVSRELANRDPDAAFAQTAQRVHDWSGGTRLGDGLRAFNDEWGQRGMARGAVVVILSDGWDRGEPDVLREQMQRLQRVAHRIVWVNPLKATAGYAPLARGMAAALPFVDAFVEGHSVSALDRLAKEISR
jgi:uncharacterized protein with von Willebrand factor type A (vWA) domain